MANNNILLISEDRLKSQSSLNDNFFSKNLLSSIKVSQDIDLQEIIGTCLYEKLKDLVARNEIGLDVNTNYKALLDNYISNYLTYITLSHLVMENSTKLNNFGQTVNNDEHIENIGLSERDVVRKQWENYADAYCKQMQRFLKANKALYPELDCGCGCDGLVKPHLDSAASSEIWLGGVRGRRIK